MFLYIGLMFIDIFYRENMWSFIIYEVRIWIIKLEIFFHLISNNKSYDLELDIF